MENEQSPSNEPNAKKNWRDLTSYWIFGLCNNFGYVVMLTAAHDILNELTLRQGKAIIHHVGNSNRPCNIMSTGAILLADIIPCLIIKLTSPFLPSWHRTRVTVSCVAAMGGFFIVAITEERGALLAGVALTSFSEGIGESTFLGYSAFYYHDVISTWSSGTGGAGIFGALAYSLFREFGLSLQITMLVMIAVPLLEMLTFFFLLSPPKIRLTANPPVGTKVKKVDTPPLNSLKQKLFYIPKLSHLMLPFCLVFFFEYFINQGLHELVYFPNIFLNACEQYRWYQVTYQVGVFVSRSSVNFFHFKRIWIMAVLQGLNVVFFFFEAYYMLVPSIWIIFGIIAFEGLLGGGAYVNTFYRMNSEIPPSRLEYAMMVVSLSDSIGILLAGFSAIPVHNWLCSTSGGL